MTGDVNERTDSVDEGGCTDIDDEPARRDDHLRDVDPGAGCTEIWEYLAEIRERCEDGSDD